MAKSLNQTLDTLNFPLAKGAKKDTETAQKEAPAGLQKSVESAVSTRLKEALAIPVIGKSDYWHLEDLSESAKNAGLLSKILKKKEIGLDEINDLKKEAVQSPGNTRAKIQRLKKLHPDNSELYMLSAICANGMLMNSSNRDEVLRGLKFAVREAATCLLSNGISLYNCDSFFRIYFVMLERLKRAQSKILDSMGDDSRLRGSRAQLATAAKSVDFLLSEKTKVNNIINHLKKKLKSSNFVAHFTPDDIKSTAHLIEKGATKDPTKFGSSAEMMSYIYALTLTFAHTPLLTRLVDKILLLLPDKETSLLCRKVSINSVRRFAMLKLAMAEGERDEMVGYARSILKENLMGISKFGGQALYHSYEADMFLNIAYVAQLTPGLFQPKEYLELVDKALNALQTLIDKDMSKGHVYTESANTHIRRLNQLKDEKKAEVKGDD